MKMCSLILTDLISLNESTKVAEYLVVEVLLFIIFLLFLLFSSRCLQTTQMRSEGGWGGRLPSALGWGQQMGSNSRVVHALNFV